MVRGKDQLSLSAGRSELWAVCTEAESIILALNDKLTLDITLRMGLIG